LVSTAVFVDFRQVLQHRNIPYSENPPQGVKLLGCGLDHPPPSSDKFHPYPANVENMVSF